MKISNYYLTGTSRDHEWVLKHRQQLEEGTMQELRDRGFYPVLDQPINITWEYTKDMKLCNYKIAAKGVRTSKQKAAEALGYMSKEGFIVSKDAREVSVLV